MNAFDSLLIGATDTQTILAAGTLDQGPFFAIQTLAECVFGQVEDNGDNGDGLDGLTIPAGIVIYGNLGDVEITSGKLRGYKK